MNPMLPLKVLIVDDEPWNREVIKQFGSWQDFHMEIVGEAENGLTAIDMIASCEPQLVITDMRMPGADGVKLLRYLHEHHEAIKVIVISGYDDFVYTQQAIRCKVHEYLLKPVDPNELNAVLDRCAQEIRSRSARYAVGGLDSGTIAELKEAGKRIALLLQDGEPDALRAAFADMHDKYSQHAHSNNLTNKVYRDFWRIWEETVILNGLNGLNDMNTHVLSPGFDSAQASWQQVIEELTYIYDLAANQLMEQRKYRSKINLQEVKQCIELQFSEPVTLESIAKQFFVSKEYLSRTFKQEFGMNISDYIVRLRMQRAKELLLQEQLSIKAVGQLVGYEDVAYFYRIFKKFYGVAPGEFRKTAASRQQGH